MLVDLSGRRKSEQAGKCQPVSRDAAAGVGRPSGVRTLRGDQTPDPRFWGSHSRARGWPGRLPVSLVTQNWGSGGDAGPEGPGQLPPAWSGPWPWPHARAPERKSG